MLDEYFVSNSTLHRNERVKLAAMFWNIVGAAMFIGGVAGAFFYEGPLFWSRVGIAVLGIVLALIFQHGAGRAEVSLIPALLKLAPACQPRPRPLLPHERGLCPYTEIDHE